MTKRAWLGLVLGMMAAITVTALSLPAHADSPLYACKPVAPSAQLEVSLRPDTSVADLAAWVTSFTCKNVVFSSGIAKRATKVTVIAPTTMTARQAVKLFVDALEAADLLVTVKTDTFVVKPGPKTPASCPDLGPSESPGTPSAPPPSTPANELTSADLDAGIRRVDDLHYEITRALLDRVLASASLMAGARVVPAVKDGKPNGFKLYAIRPSSVYARVGFANGDTVHAVNGRSLATAEVAIESFGTLRRASTFTIDLTRRGAEVTLVIVVK